MGVGLTHPIQSQRLYRKGNKFFKIGMATMHGWRETMEDAHTIELELEKHKNFAFFGIFDGHSGSLCANFIAEKLYKNIDSLPSFDDVSIAKKCLETDETFLKHEDYIYNDDGCACIFTLVDLSDPTNIKLINSNIGDSRTVFAKKKTDAPGYEAISCTFDHKPTDPAEKERIEAAGGYVSLQRVDGQLALSRAFGDRQLKTPTDAPGEKKKVTANPEIKRISGVESKDFLFLACDGIYEAEIFERQDVIDWIAKKMDASETPDLAVICGELLDECLTRGSHDNMSAMIIQFVDGVEYAKPVEFVPGPWFDGDNDRKFQAAYTTDAATAGFTLEEAHALRKQNEQKKNSSK